jgi:DnaK suppressor protein
MEKIIITKFKEIIINNIKKLSDEKIDFNVDADGDAFDEMQASTILDLAYAAKDRNTFKLNRMLQALKKIESGDYGYCEECGEDIGLKRLEIFPDAIFCVFCAEKNEKEMGKIR